MPTYDCDCSRCGGFEAIRYIGQRDEPAICPDCDEIAARVMVAALRLRLMEASTLGPWTSTRPRDMSPAVRANTPACAEIGLRRLPREPLPRNMSLRQGAVKKSGPQQREGKKGLVPAPD